MAPKKATNSTSSASTKKTVSAFGSTSSSKGVAPVASTASASPAPTQVAPVAAPAPVSAPVSAPASAPSSTPATPSIPVVPESLVLAASTPAPTITKGAPKKVSTQTPKKSDSGPEPEIKKYRKKHTYFLVDQLGYKITKTRHGVQGKTFKSSSPKYAAHKAVTRQVPNPIRIRKSGSNEYKEYEGRRDPIKQETRDENKWMNTIPVMFRPHVTPIRTVNIKEIRKQHALLQQQTAPQPVTA